MKTSNLFSVLAVLGLTLGAAGVEAQGAGDAEVLVPLARAVVGAPTEGDAAFGAVVEDLPTVYAPRWSAQDGARGAIPAPYWLGFLALCAGGATLLVTRRPAREDEPRHSLPPGAGEGRISLV